MTHSRWRIFPANLSLSQTLAEHLNVHPIIAQLLLNRSVRSLKEANAFISPESIPSVNFDRSLLQQAIDCIENCKNNNTCLQCIF